MDIDSVDLKKMLQNLPIMIYRSRNDEHWTKIFVSEGSFCLTGYKPGDLVENATVSYEEIIHPDHRDLVRTQVQFAIENKIAYHLSYMIKTAGDNEKWVMDEGYGIYSTESHELEYIEGFIVDITKQKCQEFELFDQIQQLEKQLKLLQIK
ncbi:PAS domain-containing protein [Candidatus Harpocratesius sp.]